MNENFKSLQKNLLDLVQNSNHNPERFFKQNAGDYAQHDKFLGIKVPDLRKLIKKFKSITLENILKLLQSPYNEHRLLALFF
jgi:hypothetical protein